MTDEIPPAERDTLPPSMQPIPSLPPGVPDWLDAMIHRSAEVMAEKLRDTLESFTREVAELREEVRLAVTRSDRNYEWLRREYLKLKKRVGSVESRLSDAEQARSDQDIEVSKLRGELAQLRERLR